MPEEQRQTQGEDQGGGRYGDVMVVGGGISGIQASLDLATAGYRVYLVERITSHWWAHGAAGQDLSHQ